MGDTTPSDSLIEKPDKFGDDLTEIYFNGFEVGLSLSDINIILMANGRPRCRLFASYGTAKTLMENLALSIRAFEQKAKRRVMTMGQVKKAVEVNDTGSTT